MEQSIRFDKSTQYYWVERYDPDNAFFKGRFYLVTKRLFDLLLVVLTAPLWLVVLIVVAVLIKIDSPNGPVIFSQNRTGKGGKKFSMYKFRTMVENAEELKQELMHLNELKWPDFKVSNDPRITRMGRFLRKTSLDELPQLINVLKGEMSLVGPRPTSFGADTYDIWQTERLDVVPGITGLWQLSGRGETEFRDRLKMDIAYINHRCFRVDILILYKTVFAVLQKRGAK